MNIIIASDSFKDALPSHQVCEAIAKGFQMACEGFNLVKIPLADGGEGTAEILNHHANGNLIEVQTVDPLNRQITSKYGLSPDKKTAFIDMAAASGLQHLKQSERNPMTSSSYGTGLLIADAIEKNVDEIILGIGGSATNDGGMGMARALGYKFYDKDHNLLKGTGAELSKLRNIKMTNRHFPKITVLCDVNNPLLGKDGATHTYAKQKGATERDIEQLEQGLTHFSKIVKKELDKDCALADGAGAAGGMGFGALTFLNGQLISGIDYLLDFVHFDQAIKTCDVILTGEGKLDNQSLRGKLIQGICLRAKRHHKPVIALCGSMLASPSAIKDIGLTAAFSIQQNPCTLAEAISNCQEQLSISSFQIAQMLHTFNQKAISTHKY